MTDGSSERETNPVMDEAYHAATVYFLKQNFDKLSITASFPLFHLDMIRGFFFIRASLSQNLQLRHVGFRLAQQRGALTSKTFFSFSVPPPTAFLPNYIIRRYDAIE